MRILTKTQYDAICDIVMEQKKRIEELEADLEKRKAHVKDLEEAIRNKDEAIEYVNAKLNQRNFELAAIRSRTNKVSIDYPNSSCLYH